MFILQQPVAPVGQGPPRILGDDERGNDDNTTNTGRVFQHQPGGAQPPVQAQQPPQIGGGPLAGPRPGDAFVPAVGAPGLNQDPMAQAVINLLKDVLRAVGPDGTLRAPDGTQISVQSILNDPANQPYRADLNNVTIEANRQRGDLQSRILTRTITLLKEIRNENKHQDKINQIMQRFADQQYGIAQNPDDPSYVDVVTPEVIYGRVLKSSIQEINSDPNKARELAIRTFLIQEAEIVDQNFKQETQRTTGEPYLISNADIRQIFQNVNNNQKVKNLGGGLGDGPPPISDDAASRAVWGSIEYLAVASQYGRLVNAGNTAQWLAKYNNIANRASATASRLTTPAYINRAERIARTARFNAYRSRLLCPLARGASRFPGLATTSKVGASLATKGWGVGAVAKVGGRTLPVLGAVYGGIDTGLNGINAINAFAEGESAEGWNQVARFAIKGGCMAAFCLIPGVGPLLGMTLGHLVGQGLEWLIMDGGLTKICDGISAGFKWLGEKLPALIKPLEIIAKPFVAIGSGIKKLWNSIFGKKEGVV